jgi:hypothetical protein
MSDMTMGQSEGRIYHRRFRPRVWCPRWTASKRGSACLQLKRASFSVESPYDLVNTIIQSNNTNFESLLTVFGVFIVKNWSLSLRDSTFHSSRTLILHSKKCISGLIQVNIQTSFHHDWVSLPSKGEVKLQ